MRLMLFTGPIVPLRPRSDQKSSSELVNATPAQTRDKSKNDRMIFLKLILVQT
jgi:hypothetical protein